MLLTVTVKLKLFRQNKYYYISYIMHFEDTGTLNCKCRDYTGELLRLSDSSPISVFLKKAQSNSCLLLFIENKGLCFQF